MIKTKPDPLNHQGIAHFVLPLLIVILTAVIGTYLLVAGHAGRQLPSSDEIIDVSHYQCPAVKSSRGGIVNLNKTKTHTRNPCAKKQAANIKNPAYYVNTSYTGQHYLKKDSPCQHKTKDCWAYNYGYHDGEYDLKAARSQNLFSALWWLDIEEASDWQYNDTSLNVQYLKGMVAALRNGGVSTVGIYSAPNHYRHITSNWQNNYPVWYPTGEDWNGAHSAAAEHCNDSFTGGPVWLVQYTDFRRNLDINRPCGDAFFRNL